MRWCGRWSAQVLVDRPPAPALPDDTLIDEGHVARVVHALMVSVVRVRPRGQRHVTEHVAVGAGVMPIRGRNRHDVGARSASPCVHLDAVEDGTGLRAGCFAGCTTR